MTIFLAFFADDLIGAKSNRAFVSVVIIGQKANEASDNIAVLVLLLKRIRLHNNVTVWLLVDFFEEFWIAGSLVLLNIINLSHLFLSEAVHEINYQPTSLPHL